MLGCTQVLLKRELQMCITSSEQKCDKPACCSQNKPTLHFKKAGLERQLGGRQALPEVLSSVSSNHMVAHRHSL